MTQWVATCEANYTFAARVARAILAEYTLRYGKISVMETNLNFLIWTGFPPSKYTPVFADETIFAVLEVEGCTAMPLCIDPCFGVVDFSAAVPTILLVESYRLYYMSKQDDFKMEWKMFGKPTWFEQIGA